MRVHLTRKYAERIDEVDLSNYRVGDILDLSKRDARLLIAEGWAVPVEEPRRATTHHRARAAETPRRGRKPRT